MRLASSTASAITTAPRTTDKEPHHMSFIRAYLRASTDRQDANRARQSLIDFAAEGGLKIALLRRERERGALAPP